ncbi:MAG: hypothetical protein ACPG31_00355 [Planctomycetota bacterium]
MAYDSHPTLPRIFRLGILLLLLWPAGACSSAPAAGNEPAAGAWAKLPVEYENEYFFVPLALEGEEDRVLWFLYDTGASITVVDPDSLAKVSTWDSSQGKEVRFGHMQSGPLRLGDLSARVMELNHLQHAVGRNFDGILGYRAFDQLMVEMDYQAQTMRVAEGALPPPDGVSVFALHGDNRPYLDAVIEGRRRRLLVDTGSGMGFELRSGPRYEWSVKPVTVGSSMTIDGLQRSEAGRLQQPIGFLGREYRRPLVRIANKSELVGTEILRDYRLTFDIKNLRLRIASSLPASVAPMPYLGTGAIFRPEAHGLVVMEILPGSPAEKAGLRVGDEVQRLAMTPSVHQRLQVPGQTYRFRRGNQHMHLDIPFADLVPVPQETSTE